MNRPRILVVEDNAITRKMLRVALRAESYEVIEAADAGEALAAARERAPDLVLQDLILPDVDGFELLGRLRALPGLDSVPVLAMSGLAAKLDEARLLSAGFTDFLLKPVAPSTLAELVQNHLAVPEPQAQSGRRLRVLVVDDDPAQRKLTRLRLAQLGFQVTTAADGAEALHQVRLAAPDVVVSDVFMPRLDGFAFCLAVRKDPALARIPVVLASSTYLDESDRSWAAQVGASRFVVRTPDLAEVIAAVQAVAGEPPPVPQLDEGTARDLGADLVRRLEHQATMTVSLAQRCSLQAAELAVLSGIADSLAHAHDPDTALAEVLARCLDAGGVSQGAVYVLGPQGPRLRAQAGFPAATDAPGLESFFGHPELLRMIVDSGEIVVLPSALAGEEVTRAVLAASGAASVLVAPLLWRGQRFGALVMASRGADLTHEEYSLFARSVAAQLGQSFALAQAFARLASSEQRYRLLFDANPLPVWIFDTETLDFLAVNETATRVYGYGRDEFLAMKLSDIRHPEDVALRRLEPGGGPVGRFRHRTRAGDTLQVEVWLHELEFEGRLACLAVVLDVTERVAAQEALARSEILARTILDSDPECVKLVGPDGTVHMMNAAGLRMLEAESEAEVVGASVFDFVSPEHRLDFAETLAATFQGVAARIEFDFVGRRGGRRRVEAQSVPLRNHTGEIVAHLAIARDLTEQRQLELQLRHAQKMEALGRLSGGVAHDFNNLLSVIVGYCQLAQSGLPEGDKNRQRLDEVLRAADRATDLTRQLLAFSRRQPAQLRILDLNHVVRGVDRMLRRLIGEDVELLAELADGLWPVRADPGQLEQVLMNLAVNARDAMPAGGRLTLATRNLELVPAAPARDFAGGPCVVLEATDTGTGMDAATEARVFEPFFTTKEPGRGTGLGLSTVYGIVRQSGGDIQVESAPGAGTTFRIFLPRASAGE